ncbi:coiled-coil domain-containing protein [Geomonas azotofigens]|uniref:hypothetical protein n=1 Tax=Geomonas azotofigens TaxID=2843196 RepID=UPI001C10CD26|nr:hypothetical protein [Geomonas azotofigens]MBU5614922.1 hypothetical protein [Geomonas azotofigens]
MLALDSTIGCIEVSESDVVEIYRSAPITRAGDKRPETVEAYVCAIRRKTLVKVYLGLVVNDQRLYFYSSPGKGKSDQDYAHEVEKALDYARAMGFAPERVDLSYSPAMREVVVRNTKVLRLAGTKGTGALKHGLAGAPVLPILQKNAVEAPPPSASPAPVAIPVAPPVVASTGAAAKVDSDGGELLGALAQSQHEQRSLVAERDALTQQLRQLSALHQAATDELGAARQSREELTGERDALLCYRRQAEESLASKEARIAELELQAAELQQQAADLRRELEVLASRHAEQSGEREALVENLAQARQDITRLSAERDSALAGAGTVTQRHLEATGQLEEIRKELAQAAEAAVQASRRIEALEESGRVTEKELASLRREVAAVTAERDAALKRLAVRDGERGSDEAELERLRQELGRAAEERDAALARLAAAEERRAPETEREPARLQPELERLEAERDALLRRVAALEEEQAGRMESVQRQPEWQRAQQEESPEPAPVAAPSMMAFEPAGPDEEVAPSRILPGLQDGASQPLPTFTEDTLPPFDELQAPPEPSAPLPPADAPEVATTAETRGFSFGGQETAFLPLGDLQDGFFSAAGDGEPVRFLLETGRDAIDCPSADDVLELHHSINNAYLSPEGSGGQESCQGFVCCLRKGEGKEVVAAIYGTASHRTRVYLPESQPVDEESYARTVRGAISFAEEVGLMMERVPLEATGQKRQERLKRCPALRIPEQR